jgi:hypothetical protein
LLQHAIGLPFIGPVIFPEVTEQGDEGLHSRILPGLDITPGITNIQALIGLAAGQ